METLGTPNNRTNAASCSSSSFFFLAFQYVDGERLPLLLPLLLLSRADLVLLLPMPLHTALFRELVGLVKVHPRLVSAVEISRKTSGV